MDGNYFIIHGSYGSPYKNWIPWLKNELSKRKKDVIVPHFPSFAYQRFDNWAKILDAYLDIGCIDENTIFITHSLGGIFIIKFLLMRKIKVNKIVTVAGFNNIKYDDIDLYKSFYVDDEDLVSISDYCEDIICLYSDNDPYVGLDNAKNFALNIKGEEVLINGAGHFNEQSGYKEFKELLDYIR